MPKVNMLIRLPGHQVVVIRLPGYQVNFIFFLVSGFPDILHPDLLISIF
jgi:hypothetical protein